MGAPSRISFALHDFARDARASFRVLFRSPRRALIFSAQHHFSTHAFEIYSEYCMSRECFFGFFLECAPRLCVSGKLAPSALPARAAEGRCLDFPRLMVPLRRDAKPYHFSILLCSLSRCSYSPLHTSVEPHISGSMLPAEYLFDFVLLPSIEC